jgi:hypothetical protein
MEDIASVAREAVRVPRQVPAAVAFAAWAVFVVSLFLPTTTVGGTEPLTGWEACTTWLEVFRDPLFLVVMVMQPGLLLLLLLPFVDFAMLFAPLPALVWEDAWVLAGVFIPVGLLPCLFKVGAHADIFVGFYLWGLSFFMMGAACIFTSICRRQFYESEIKTRWAGFA